MKKQSILCVLFFLLVVSFSCISISQPVIVSAQTNPLQTKDLSVLKKKLKKKLSSFPGSWSVYVKNLDTDDSICINNQKMYAASLIKLYALAGAYEKIQKGTLKESSIYHQMYQMITQSDNSCFNNILRAIGKSYVNKWCNSNGFKNTNQGHGSFYAPNYHGLDNGSGENLTCVKDCGKLLESIYKGTCVSQTASNKMLSLLKAQTRRSKIPAGIPRGITIANKTGETDDYTHDVAIVYSKGATYIICVMGHVPGNAWGTAKNVTTLSKITYNFFNS